MIEDKLEKIKKSKEELISEFKILIYTTENEIKSALDILYEINKENLYKNTYSRSELSLKLGDIAHRIAKLIIKDKNEKSYLKKLGLHNVTSFYQTEILNSFYLPEMNMTIMEMDSIDSLENIKLFTKSSHLIDIYNEKIIPRGSECFDLNSLNINEFKKSIIFKQNEHRNYSRADIIFYYRNNYGSHSEKKNVENFFEKSTFVSSVGKISDIDRGFNTNQPILEATMIQIGIEIVESLKELIHTHKFFI